MDGGGYKKKKEEGGEEFFHTSIIISDFLMSDLVKGQWRFSEWSMVNGENSVILLLLNYYANSSSPISVISSIRSASDKNQIPLIAH